MSDEIKEEATDTPQEKAESTEKTESPVKTETASTVEKTDAKPKTETRPVTSRPPHRTNGRPKPGPRGAYQGSHIFKKKYCKFCKDKKLTVHYRNVDILERFITDRGKILPRRITGTCSKHQRHISLSIKRARLLALLPFVVQ